MEKGVYVRKLFDDIIVCFGNSARREGEKDYYKKNYSPCLKSLLRLQRAVERRIETNRGHIRLLVDPIGWLYYWESEEEVR